jgi:hypothetical protein
MLAAEMDDEAAGLKRGEFAASIRQCAECLNWSIGAVHRFLQVLLENSMIMRVEQQAKHLAEHFRVCNYETYNPPRYTSRNTERNTESPAGQDAGHFSVCNHDTCSLPRYTGRDTERQGVYINNNKDTHNTPAPAGADACVSPKILLEIYQQHNQALPEVKALTVERLRKCRSRINQAVRDGCLEQYLADFVAAVKKAQSTPFLRGEGARGWRASFDWFVANQLNVYAVLEGKYDGPAFAKASAGKPAVASAKVGPNHGGGNDNASFDGGRSRPPEVQRPGAAGRTSRGDPIYFPRQ